MIKEPGETKTYVHLHHQIRKPACNCILWLLPTREQNASTEGQLFTSEKKKCAQSIRISHINDVGDKLEGGLFFSSWVCDSLPASIT